MQKIDFSSSKIDPRHEARKLAVLRLYSEFFGSQEELPEELVFEVPKVSEADIAILEKIVNGVKGNASSIDELITKCAPEWPIDRIARLDLAILRVATFELMDHGISKSVVIDEAIELAKEFGSESSGKFVNGVLGSVVELIKQEPDKKI